MAKDRLTNRQRCVLYLLLLLPCDEDGWVRWLWLDDCSSLYIQPKESLDEALAVLATREYVVLHKYNLYVRAVRLTLVGREIAESIKVIRVMPFINHRELEKLTQQ